MVRQDNQSRSPSGERLLEQIEHSKLSKCPGQKLALIGNGAKYHELFGFIIYGRLPTNDQPLCIRSDLMDSLIVYEGSRTGFYTDNYDEQDIKPVDEIRKGDLRCADLRGANNKGVDFYLVNLRGVRYIYDQARQFHHCRATVANRTGS